MHSIVKVLMSMALVFAVVALLPNLALAKKYRYCVVAPIDYNMIQCSDCWSLLGGEFGRIDCGVRVGPGSVRYGWCHEHDRCEYGR
jgi:hypothetical protein